MSIEWIDDSPVEWEDPDVGWDLVPPAKVFDGFSVTSEEYQNRMGIPCIQERTYIHDGFAVRLRYYRDGTISSLGWTELEIKEGLYVDGIWYPYEPPYQCDKSQKCTHSGTCYGQWKHKQK